MDRRDRRVKSDATADYAAQHRGDDGAYDRYLAGMDASMRQKVALTAAHLLSEGDLVDMGMGSGKGSAALAGLYPDLQVVGVDIDPQMVARASATYRRANLRFVVGDVAGPLPLPPGSVEAILDSSVLHHVTSYNGYERALAARALAVQAELLAPDGVLILRDFVDPGPGLVWLDLPADDFTGEADGDDPRDCSTAALFERFASELRRLREDPAARGFAYRRLAPVPDAPPVPQGWRRYEVARTAAVEFVLRKDYRDSWAVEVQEEYTFATQAELEATFAGLGLRVLASTPLRNPWIVANRFEGRFVLRDPVDGRELDWPATNYVIVGQRVREGCGVRFDGAPVAEPARYLESSCWRRAGDGVVYDLIRRPGPTVDVVPWFERGGAVYVLARRAYPRPILGWRPAGPAGRPIDGSTPATWVTEPLNVPLTDRPLTQTVQQALAHLYGLDAVTLRRFEPGARYFPSPGGVQEEVRSVFVALDPVHVRQELAGSSGFSSSGQLRAIEARQVLRAAQVGGLPDSRLELNVYDLLLRRGVRVGPWIGAALEVPEGPAPPRTARLEELRAAPPRRRFQSAPLRDSSGFLALARVRFDERDAAGVVVASNPLEVVTPRRYRLDTVVTACLRRWGGRIWLGVDDDDLPAAQCFDGHSNLLVAPAWRLPAEVDGAKAAVAWVRERLAREYGVGAGAMVPLGGPWYPSPGVTPEVVHAYAVVVTDEAAGAARALTWVDLDALVAGRAQLREGHLRTVAQRAAHALGRLASPSGG
ncbi:MAG: SAM-dependent methyltransferase [Proteobacteria bacterium]|nr:MAG: SAM-dependent methyltransferase [Pseudomonadota bacterium]